MKANKRIAAAVLLLVFLISAEIVHAAADISAIKPGETTLRDWFAANQTVKNEGTIKGDMISAAQTLNSSGSIEGDLIGAAGNVGVSGTVLGNVRVAGGNIIFDGKVNKNVNLFGGNVNINPDSLIGGNLLVYGGNVKMEGKVAGYTRLGAGKIILNGEFGGDVDINLEADPKNTDNPTTLTILPGTVIHGTLTYKGINQADIREGTNIKEVKWIKPDINQLNKVNRKEVFNFWHFIKMLIAMAVYFLISLVFYKIFPKLFIHQGNIIQKKPLNIIGTGLIGILTVIAALIIFVLFLAFTVLAARPTAAIALGAVTTAIYVTLFYFSTVPVSIWLGNYILKDMYSLPVRFGAGLTIITLCMYSLELLSKIQGIGLIFSIILFTARLAVITIGTGSLMHVLWDVLNIIRKHDSNFNE